MILSKAKHQIKKNHNSYKCFKQLPPNTEIERSVHSFSLIDCNESKICIPNFPEVGATKRLRKFLPPSVESLLRNFKIILGVSEGDPQKVLSVTLFKYSIN